MSENEPKTDLQAATDPEVVAHIGDDEQVDAPKPDPGCTGINVNL